MKPDEIVPFKLRARLNWHDGHDAAAKAIMQEFNLMLPRDRELIRTLTFVRVRQGPLPWI